MKNRLFIALFILFNTGHTLAKTTVNATFMYVPITATLTIGQKAALGKFTNLTIEGSLVAENQEGATLELQRVLDQQVKSKATVIAFWDQPTVITFPDGNTGLTITVKRAS